MLDHDLRTPEYASTVSACLVNLRFFLEVTPEDLPTDPTQNAPTDLPDAVESDQTEERIPAALEILAARLGLSAFEQNVLLLCAAMEYEPRIAGLCALAQGDSARPYPTFTLALTLFDDPAWDVLSSERPLRRLKLIEVNQPGATPLTVVEAWSLGDAGGAMSAFAATLAAAVGSSGEVMPRSLASRAEARAAIPM